MIEIVVDIYDRHLWEDISEIFVRDWYALA